MASLQEVAARAGVSTATVSRVLNKSDKVNGQTRERVLAAVHALGYQPSRVARRLRVRKGHAHLLGLLIPDIQNAYFSNIVRGIEDVAYANGYATILCNTDEDTEKEKFYLEVLRAESVDGIILPPIQEHGKIVSLLAEEGLPVVCVDRRLANATVDSVVVNNRQGAFEAVSLLVSHGHQRIGMISGPAHFSSIKERREGYEQALSAAGLSLIEALIRTGDLRQDSATVLAGQMLDLSEPPTALLIANNLMALGAIEAVHDRHVRIPEDLAIISFDDMPWARSLNPPLTVVRQPAYEMGKRSAELLFQRIADPLRDPVQEVLEPALIVRRSCGTRG